MTNLEIALSYRDRGLSVIPLWSPEMVKKNPPKYYTESLNKKLNDNSKEEDPLPEEDIIQKHFIEQCKHSLVKWTEYQKRLPTKEEVHHWLTVNPSANIGIITGKISNIVVFDLDSKHAEEYAEEQGGFPETAKVKTGKGYHLYMKRPGFEVRGSVNKKLDIDIRADGNYVVAPPSVHGSDRMYEWEKGSSIFEIDPTECTPWMMDYLEDVAKDNKPSLEKKDNTAEKTVKGAEKGHQDKSDYLNILKDGCSEGDRNQTATRLIGHLLKKDIAHDELWELVKQWNIKNSPPIDEAELRRTFESVKKEEKASKTPKVSVSSFLDNTKEVISDYDQNYVRVPFGDKNLSVLEKGMNGGLVGGRLYLLGGIPSSGKTVLTNNIADNICLNDHPVLFFSYDDGKSELLYRTFARLSSHTIEEFNTKLVSTEVIEKICEDPAIQKIRGLKYVVQEMFSVEKWDDLIEQIKREHKKAPVIIIDYLRKLRTEQKISDERLRVDAILSKLTDLAKRYNIPIVAISELARDSYKSGQRLSMASFKESGSIEFEASWLGILAVVEEKDGDYNLKHNWERIIEHDGNVDLIVFKCKRGTGMTGKIPLKIDKDKMTVIDRKDHPDLDTTSTITKPSIFD